MNEKIIDPDLILKLTPEFPDIGEHVSQLYPELYKEEDVYCCVSGSGPIEGFIGRGSTPIDALRDWYYSYKEATANGKI